MYYGLDCAFDNRIERERGIVFVVLFRYPFAVAGNVDETPAEILLSRFSDDDKHRIVAQVRAGRQADRGRYAALVKIFHHAFDREVCKNAVGKTGVDVCSFHYFSSVIRFTRKSIIYGDLFRGDLLAAGSEPESNYELRLDFCYLRDDLLLNRRIVNGQNHTRYFMIFYFSALEALNYRAGRGFRQTAETVRSRIRGWTCSELSKGFDLSVCVSTGRCVLRFPRLPILSRDMGTIALRKIFFQDRLPSYRVIQAEQDSKTDFFFSQSSLNTFGASSTQLAAPIHEFQSTLIPTLLSPTTIPVHQPPFSLENFFFTFVSTIRAIATGTETNSRKTRA